MAAFVVDTSVAGSWILADEYDAQTQVLAEQVANSGAIAPALLLYEVRNLLVSAIRSQRVDAATADGSMAELRLLPITFMEPNPDTLVFALAAAHRLSGYYATFLALAKQQKLPLATLDRRLRNAAAQEAIEVLPKALV